MDWLCYVGYPCGLPHLELWVEWKDTTLLASGSVEKIRVDIPNEADIEVNLPV